MSVSLFPPFIQIVGAAIRLDKLDAKAQAGFRNLHARSKEDAAFIEEEIENHFRRVRAHHLVAMWSATETCVETTLQNCYLHLDRAHEIARRHGYTSAKIARSAWEARNMVRGWRDKLQEMPELKRDEAVLRAFQIPVSFDDGDVGRADEISGIRNCIVHNKGVVGSHLLTKCPRLQARWREGDEILLESQDCTDAFDVCSGILLAILDGVVRSGHLQSR